MNLEITTGEALDIWRLWCLGNSIAEIVHAVHVPTRHVRIIISKIAEAELEAMKKEGTYDNEFKQV